MKPSLHRNVSSILISLEEKHSEILLDCGEGTYQQIYSHYGDSKTNEILNNLKLIFITHKHGDHLLGLPKILLEKSKLPLETNKLLYIVLPYNCIKWVENLINSFDPKFKDIIKIIDCQEINPSDKLFYSKFINKRNPYENFKDVSLESKETVMKTIETFKSNVYKYNNLALFYEYINKEMNIEIYSVEVFHCDDSFGCILQSYSHNITKNNENTWKISYSGDTRPCNNFINFSAESSNIIHEATLDNELADQAKEKLHTCFKEAVDVGKLSNSWRTSLTHFSPRYMKESPWEESFMLDKVLIANDYLSIKLSELEIAYKYGEKASNVLQLLAYKAIF